MHRKNILIYIQQDATLHSLFYLETALDISGGTSTPSSGAHATLSTASGICHTVTAICRFCGRVGTGLSVLWVAYVFCAPDDGWWYHPKHVEQFPVKINCVTLHLVGYILEYILSTFCYKTKYNVTYIYTNIYWRKERRFKNIVREISCSVCLSVTVNLITLQAVCYTSSNDRMVGEKCSITDVVAREGCLVWSTIQLFVWKQWRKARKFSVSILGASTEIQST